MNLKETVIISVRTEHAVAAHRHLLFNMWEITEIKMELVVSDAFVLHLVLIYKKMCRAFIHFISVFNRHLESYWREHGSKT